MRRIIWFMLPGLLLFPCLGAGEEAAGPEQIQLITLDNGLSVLVDPHPGAALVHMAFAIGLGSRDEKAEENGLVHLLEHVMLLGGSQDIPAREFSTRLRSAGVYFNAHTDHDLMTLEFTFAPQRLSEVLALARVKLFATLITPESLEREKRAIAEEINQLMDDPSSRGRQAVMAALFSGHPYARPVWGDPGVIEKVQPQALENWYRRYFIPNNMAVAITGGLDAAGILDQVRLHFTDLSAGPTVDRALPPLPPLGKGTEAAETMDITEHHFFMGFRAPAQAEAHRLPFDMLAQIFGRGINPLLRQALRAANPDLVDAFNLQYIPLDRAGLLFIHIRSGADKSSRLRREIGRFFVVTARMPFALEDMHPQVRHGAVDHMANAVTHLRMLYHSFQENGLSLASAYARSLMMQKEAQDEPYLTRLAKLKSKDLNRAIDTHLAGKNHVSVHIGPLEKK